MIDLNKLEELAKAATAGPWIGDRNDGTVKYDLLGANDCPVIRGNNMGGDDLYGIVKEEDEKYLIAANPATILELIALIRKHEAEIKMMTAALDAQGELTDRYQEIALSAQAAAPTTRKAFICKGCEGVYADAPVTQCDCMPDKQEWIEAAIVINGDAQAAEPVVADLHAQIMNLLADQKGEVSKREGDWWRGYGAALHWISKQISDEIQGGENA